MRNPDFKLNRAEKLQRLVGLLILMGAFASCVRNEDLNLVRLEVQLEFPAGVEQAQKSNIPVTLTSVTKGTELSGLTNTDGLVVFDRIEPGSYMIKSSMHLKGRSGNTILNGNESFSIEENSSTSLHLKIAKLGTFVISQYYYSGSLSPAGKKFNRDQFLEIYNNSDDTLYADNLSIVEHEADGNSMSEWKDQEPTHMVVKLIWTIPGNGTDVPLAPGKSLLFAPHAFNYKTDSLGISTAPVDLGHADFELYIENEINKNENPNVPNLELTFLGRPSTSKFAFGTRGGSAMALAWLPEDKDAYIESNLLPMLMPNGTTHYFCKIQNEFVEDAVDVVWNDRIFKRLDPSLDAGYVTVESGSWTGLGIRRYVENEVGGRKVLKDTNNSTVDFEHDVVPEPHIFDMN